MAAGLTFLIMRQVMPIAAGLSHAVALQSYGVVSRAVSWSARHGVNLAQAGIAYAAVYPSRMVPPVIALRVPRP
jgi:type IV secretion system protein VirB6